MRREIRAEKVHPPLGHYTDAVQLGDLLYLSGCGPTGIDQQLVGGDDATLQAEQVYANIGHILEAAGATPADVLSVTTFLTDAADAHAVNEAKKAFFGDARSASATVIVADLLVPGARVEVQAVARIPSQG